MASSKFKRLVDCREAPDFLERVLDYGRYCYKTQASEPGVRYEVSLKRTLKRSNRLIAEVSQDIADKDSSVALLLAIGNAEAARCILSRLTDIQKSSALHQSSLFLLIGVCAEFRCLECLISEIGSEALDPRSMSHFRSNVHGALYCSRNILESIASMLVCLSFGDSLQEFGDCLERFQASLATVAVLNRTLIREHYEDLESQQIIVEHIGVE